MTAARAIPLDGNRASSCNPRGHTIVSDLPPLASAEEKPDYDLLVTGGCVVDGTGNPWFAGDVAVKGDRVVAVGRVTGKAKRAIHLPWASST